MVLQVLGEILNEVPDLTEGSLEDFFVENPSICENNIRLTSLPHYRMGRDEVLFIRQRMQATSDYRENSKVRWIGMNSFTHHR